MPEIAAAAFGSGTSKMTKAPGPSVGTAKKQIILPPAASTIFFGDFGAIGGWILHHAVKRLRRVLPGDAKMHGILLSKLVIYATSK
jgi:hypothetical protein